GAVGVALGRASYAIALLATLGATATAATALLSPGLLGEGLVLPIGLPWLGAHFRVDALSAFFLVIINLGGAAASLYGLGYGRHVRRRRARARHDRRGIEGRPRAAACLAAARAPGGADARLGADERRDDQGRGVRLRAHRLRSARLAGVVVGCARRAGWRHHG